MTVNHDVNRVMFAFLLGRNQDASKYMYNKADMNYVLRCIGNHCRQELKQIRGNTPRNKSHGEGKANE